MGILSGRLTTGVSQTLIFDICNPSATMFDAQLFLQP